MSKFTVILSFVIVYVCCIAIGLGDNTVSGGGVSPGSTQVSPKNVRILSPAASRLYRLLRRGLSGDDDDLYTEDENYLRKRQGQYDDYGHMRFGKRTAPAKDFDDYGHMRFGK